MQLRLSGGVKRVGRGHLLQQRQRIVEAALPEADHPQQKPDRRPIGLESHRDLKRVPGGIEIAREHLDQAQVALNGRIVLVRAGARREFEAHAAEALHVLARRRTSALVDQSGERRHANRARRIVERREERGAAERRITAVDAER